MSWTTPRTWVTGELVSAALLNAHLRDQLVVLNPAGCTAVLDNGGAAFSGGSGCSSGSYLAWEMPYSGCLQVATVYTDKASDLELQIWKVAYASLPGTSAFNICGNSPLRTLSAITQQNTALTTWTTCFAQGDWFIPRVIGSSAPTRAMLALRWNRT